MTTVVSNAREIAAIDLGSNSFHMVVAKVVDQDLQLISRHKQRVRLAAGLDEQKISMKSRSNVLRVFGDVRRTIARL